MNMITVNVSTQYNVLVGSGILQHLHNYLPSSHTGTAVIISDENVWPLYGLIVENTLNTSCIQVKHYIVPAGESSKRMDVFTSIVNYLAGIHFTRSDLLVALGGGVVGDLTGFVAATYLRGVPYIQIPTSLLAMVDASIGGKTAINIPAGKNLLGAFYQPNLVICDTDVLATLPECYFRDGCAEIVKYGVLYDPTLFSHLENNVFDFNREYVITRCIELKRDVISTDEFDTGDRQKLNLGHTVGHSVERLSDFTISHGQAIAFGLNTITKAAVSLGLCAESTYQRIHCLLKSFRFDLTLNFSASSLFDNMLTDKKRFADSVNLIIPQSIGSCSIRKTPIHELQSIIEAGL